MQNDKQMTRIGFRNGSPLLIVATRLMLLAIQTTYSWWMREDIIQGLRAATRPMLLAMQTTYSWWMREDIIGLRAATRPMLLAMQTTYLYIRISHTGLQVTCLSMHSSTCDIPIHVRKVTQNNSHTGMHTIHLFSAWKMAFLLCSSKSDATGFTQQEHLWSTPKLRPKPPPTLQLMHTTLTSGSHKTADFSTVLPSHAHHNLDTLTLK